MKMAAAPRNPVVAGRMRRARHHARGFTLVEAVISAGLLGFLAVTATFFWVNNFRLVSTVNSDSAAIADGRAVLERLEREIREVKYAGAAYCITSMTATRLTFNKTSGSTIVTTCGGATPDGTKNDMLVDVQLSGTNLNLTYSGTLASPATSKALTSYASAFAIRYLDSAYAVTASASTVRFVELTLTVRPTGGQATQTRAVVALRNE